MRAPARTKKGGRHRERQPMLNTNNNTHTYTHTHTHTHACIYTPTKIFTHTPGNTYTYRHTHGDTTTPTHIHTHTLNFFLHAHTLSSSLLTLSLSVRALSFACSFLSWSLMLALSCLQCFLPWCFSFLFTVFHTKLHVPYTVSQEPAPPCPAHVGRCRGSITVVQYWRHWRPSRGSTKTVT